jgi:hypothetical protein
VTRDDDDNNNGNINNTENSFDESEWISQCDRLTQKTQPGSRRFSKPKDVSTIVDTET